MNTPSPEDIIQALLDGQRDSLAHELGIAVEDDHAASLFRLLCVSMLYQGNVSRESLARVSRIMDSLNWGEPRNLSGSTVEERVTALEQADYILFGEREQYARRLGELVEAVQTRYAGDVRNLRRRAEEKPERERFFLRELPGMGAVQTDFFLQEVQAAWCELLPYLGERALMAADGLGLTADSLNLAKIPDYRKWPRLAAALDDVQRTASYEEVLRRARELQRV